MSMLHRTALPDTKRHLFASTIHTLQNICACRRLQSLLLDRPIGLSCEQQQQPCARQCQHTPASKQRHCNVVIFEMHA